MKRSVLDDQDYFESLKFVAAKNRKDLQQRVIRSLPLASSNSRLNRCALPHPDGTKRDEEYLLSVHYRHHASAAITTTSTSNTASPLDDDSQRNFTPLTLLRRVVDVLQSFESIRWDYVAFPTKRDGHHLFPKDQNAFDEEEEDRDSLSSSNSTTEENAHAKQLARGIAQAKADFADSADLTADDLALLGTLASGDTEFLASIHGYSSSTPGGHASGGGGCEVGTVGLELPRPDTALLSHGRITGAASSQHVSQSINHHTESNRLNASSTLRVGANDTAIDIFTRLVQTECASVLVLLELYGALTEFDRRIRGAILARRGALNKLKRQDDRERASISTMDQIGTVLKNIAKNAKGVKSVEATMIEHALRGSALDESTDEEDDAQLSSPGFDDASSPLNSSGALSGSYGSEGDFGADSLNGSMQGDTAERDRQRDQKRDQRRHARESKARSKVRKAQRKKVVNHLLKQEELAKATLKSASQEVRDRAGSAANQEAATAAAATAAAHEQSNESAAGGGSSAVAVDRGSLRRKSSTIAERRAKMIEASQKEKKRLAEYNSIKRKRTEIQIHVEYLDVADELVDTLQQAYLSITSSAVAALNSTASGRLGGSGSFADSTTASGSTSLLRANCPLLMVRLFDLQLSASDGSPNRCFPSLLPPVTPFYFPRYKLDELQQLMRMQDDDDGMLMDATTNSNSNLRSPRSGKSDPSVAAYVPPRHTITHAEAYCREFVEESIQELRVDARRIDHQRRTLEILGLSSADQMVEAFTNKREQLLWDVGQREEELDKQRRRLGIRAQMGKMSNADAQFEIAAITEEIDRMYKVVPGGLSDEELQLMYTAPASPFQHAAAARIRSSALAAQLQSGGLEGDDAIAQKSNEVDEAAEPFSRGLLIPTHVPKHVLSFSDEDGGMESDAACVAESIKGYYLTPLHLRRLQVSSVSLFSPSEVLLSYAHQLKRDLHTTNEAKSNQQNRQRNAALFGPYSHQSGGIGTTNNASVSSPPGDDVRGARTNSYKFPMAVTVTLQDTLKTFLSTTLIPELLLRLEGDFKHYCASYKVLESVASSAATSLPLSVNLKNLEKRMEMFKGVSSSSAVKSGASKTPQRDGAGGGQRSDRGLHSPDGGGDAGGTSLGGTFAALDKEFDDAIAAVASELDRAKEKKLQSAELEAKRKATERSIEEKREREEQEARGRAATRELERQRLKAEDDKKKQLQEQRRQDAKNSALEAERAQQEILSQPLTEARRKLEGRLSEKVRAQVATSAAYPSLEVQMRIEGSPGNRRVARRTQPTYENETELVSSADEDDSGLVARRPQTPSERKALLVEDTERSDALSRQEDFNMPRNNLTRALNQKGLETKFLGPLVTASGKPVNPLTSANSRTQPSAELIDIVDNIDRKMSHEREYSDKTMQRKRRELEDRLADRYHEGVLQQHEATKHDRRSETRRVQKDVTSQRTNRQNILDMYAKAGFDDSTTATRSVQSAPSPGKKPPTKLPKSGEGWGSHGDSADVLTRIRQDQTRHELDSHQLSAKLRGDVVPRTSDIEVQQQDITTMKPVKAGAKYAHFSRSAASSDKLLNLALSSLGFDDELKESSQLQRQIDVANNPHNPLRTHHEYLTPTQKSEIETLKIPLSKPLSIVDVYALGRNDTDNTKAISSTTSADIDNRKRSRLAKVAEVTAPAIQAASQKQPKKVQWDEEEEPHESSVFERFSILQNNEVSEDPPTEQEAPQSKRPECAPKAEEPPRKVVQKANLHKARARTSSAQREIGNIGFVSIDTPVAQ